MTTNVSLVLCNVGREALRGFIDEGTAGRSSACTTHESYDIARSILLATPPYSESEIRKRSADTLWNEIRKSAVSLDQCS